MAGAWHGVPLLVLAPHLGAEFGSPLGFPFFNGPLRGVPASSLRFSMIVLGRVFRRLMANWTYYSLSAFLDVEVFHNHSRIAFASMTIERFHQSSKSSQ